MAAGIELVRRQDIERINGKHLRESLSSLSVGRPAALGTLRGWSAVAGVGAVVWAGPVARTGTPPRKIRH